MPTFIKDRSDRNLAWFRGVLANASRDDLYGFSSSWKAIIREVAEYRGVADRLVDGYGSVEPELNAFSYNGNDESIVTFYRVINKEIAINGIHDALYAVIDELIAIRAKSGEPKEKLS